MHRSFIAILSLSLFTVAGLACDPAPTSPSMSRGQELATELLERNPDLAVLSLDDERIVATDDDECVSIDDAQYCVAGSGTDEPAPTSLTTPEPDPEQLGSTCVIVDSYLYCDFGYGGGGGGGGGCDPVDCGPCRPRATSTTGFAEWCGCLGWVECYPDDAP